VNQYRTAEFSGASLRSFLRFTSGLVTAAKGPLSAANPTAAQLHNLLRTRRIDNCSCALNQKEPDFQSVLRCISHGQWRKRYAQCATISCALRISRVQLSGPFSMSLAFCDSLAVISVNQRWGTAIESPSPAFDQPNPAATESWHRKECDSIRRTGRRACKTNDHVQGARGEDDTRSKTARRVLPWNALFAFAFLQLCDSAARSFRDETH
jgi:hypothetical protein